MKLGLIGHNIGASQAPDIHKRLGELFKISISYDLFDLQFKEESYFFDLLEELHINGFTGVNITFPFKEKVIKYSDKINKSSSRVSSANTLIFKKNIIAHNTDYSGFIRTYDFHFKKTKPGKILVIGGGGVGRAIIFALCSLGVEDLYLLETEILRGENLIKELEFLDINCTLLKYAQLENMISNFNGIINCTPVGHYDFPGCPLGNLLPRNYQWLFDAVYTPAKTIFIKKGEKVGATIISGIDLFIFQALDAFLLFSNNSINEQDILKHTHHLRQHYFKSLSN